jgi:hypothetical protein
MVRAQPRVGFLNVTDLADDPGRRGLEFCENEFVSCVVAYVVERARWAFT